MASVQASDAPLGAVALDTIAAAAATPPLNAAIVKEAMAKHDDRRHARRGKPRAESKSFRPRFYTKEQLEEKAPSIQAGMAPEKYARAQRQYTIMIKEMCQKMRHTSSINFAAVSFCHLFYAVRSIQANDWWLVAIAAVLLAGKTENSPRSMMNILHVATTVKPLNAHTSFAAMLKNKQQYDWLCDLVLKAERSLLYTVGFRLHFDHPHFQIERLASDYQLERHYRAKAGFTLSQFAANFLADSYKLTMSLRHPPEKMAIGALYSAVRETKTQVPPLEDGQLWFGHAGSNLAEMEEFYKDIKRLYASKSVPSKTEKAATKAAIAAAQQSSMPAASAAQSSAPPSQGTLLMAPGTPVSVPTAPQQRPGSRCSPDDGSVGSAPSQLNSSLTCVSHSLNSKRNIDATSQLQASEASHTAKRQRQLNPHPHTMQQHAPPPIPAASEDELEVGELPEDGELPETAAYA